jgi:AcrR family transcriptional regulator
MARMVSTPELNHRAAAVRTALLHATSELLLERGAEPTLEDVAERANVGRRTIFRYFSTKDDLIAEAIAADIREFAASVPERAGRDVEEWLEDVARLIHGHNLRIASGFLQLFLRRREIAGVAQFTGRPGRTRRHDRMQALAAEVWSARGGHGQVPESVADSFTLHLSVFASEALRFHCQADADHMARLTVETLLALLDASI